MRVLLGLSLLLGACFKPSYDEGMICGEDRFCPEGQTCGADRRCRVDKANCTGDQDCPLGLSCDHEGVCRQPCASHVCEAGWATMRQGCFCIETMEAVDPDSSFVATGLDFGEAVGICAQLGGYVCREDQWMAACAGYTLDRIYPYGNSYSSTRCNDDGTVKPPGTYPSCETPEGVFDLSGNVAERVACEEGYCAVHGGSATSVEGELDCFAHYEISEVDKGSQVGFRCCKDLGEFCTETSGCVTGYYCDAISSICRVVPYEFGDPCDRDEDCGGSSQLVCDRGNGVCTVRCRYDSAMANPYTCPDPNHSAPSVACPDPEGGYCPVHPSFERP